MFLLNNMNEYQIDFSFLPQGTIDSIKKNAKAQNKNITTGEVMQALHQSYRKYYKLNQYEPTSLRPNAMIQPMADADKIISEAMRITTHRNVYYRSPTIQSVTQNSSRPQFQDSHNNSNRGNLFNRMNLHIHPQ